MNIAEVALIATFVVLLLLITLEKVDKLIGGVLGGIIVFFILFLAEGFVLQRGDLNILEFIDFSVILTILGIFVSVEVIRESGFFQWLGIKGIKATKGRSYPLFILLCIVSSILSGIVTSIAVMIIVGSLTVDIAKILDINPLPYLAAEAITVNVGTLVTPIASIPNIIVLGRLEQASFGFYAVNLAPFSLFLIPITIFILMKRSELLEEPGEDRRLVLMEFSEWAVVSNRKLFKRAAFLFITMIVSFILLPNLFPAVKLWLVSVIFMFIFLALPETDAGELIKNIEWDTIFFLIGLFIMVEGLSHKGLLLRAAQAIQTVVGGREILSILLILWFSFFASGVIDNIAVTIAILPVVMFLIESPELQAIAPVILTTLIIGVNLGGNLTPMASPTTVLAMSLSKRSGQELTPTMFFKIGFLTTMLQVTIASVYLLVVYFLTTFLRVSMGMVNVFTLIAALFGYMGLYSMEAVREKLERLVSYIRDRFSKAKKELMKVLHKLLPASSR
ncbi:MAG: hypothetical protein GWO20_14990 [Candidatus Korarchaeota archaeon]|nr:hypothetical protein [Candidatus Korarchaeota archaeon]NIU84728.1 hypothetical protein [Candidatus Thorarchaeota archaeon]NIW14730.1 hypothetical protein [Candidatus Thorarchaeota archaeon]NIW52804.1 hypothetical protein [Candidatus Korarchaeota archaeon]